MTAFDNLLDAAVEATYAHVSPYAIHQRHGYLPQLAYTGAGGKVRKEQFGKGMYASRAEAFAKAEAQIAKLKQKLRTDLLNPANRALRKFHKLPADLPMASAAA